MKKTNSLMVFTALVFCGFAQAASYTSPDIHVKESSPKFHPSKPAAYEDSYHIAGVNWGSTDRAIASETPEREPSSEVVPYEPKEPKPWLHKETDDREKY